MAIVFVSSKKRERMVLALIISGLVLFMATLSAVTFLPQFNQVFGGVLPEPLLTVSAPMINFNVVDSPRVADLELFVGAHESFSYVAKDKSGKQAAGILTAADIETAKRLLEARGLAEVQVSRAAIGRDNPFKPL